MPGKSIPMAILWIVLVLAGISLRLTFQDVPNFAPVAGLALFAGFAFKNRWAALAAPVAVMVYTDRQIGGYDAAMMAAVYAGLALPVLFGRPLQGVLQKGPAMASTVGVLGFAAASSVSFFLLSNFACWLSGMYPMTASGLGECYAMALPFFRYTLLGDAVFAGMFFGVYALAAAWSAERATSEASITTI